MDLSLESPIPDDLNERKAKILKEYLGPFYVQPIKDPSQRKNMEAFFKAVDERGEFVYPAFVRSRKEMAQLAQHFLLRNGSRLFWKAFNSYEFVQAYLNGEDPISMTLSFPAAVIYHLGTEMANKRLPELVNQVLEIRRIKQMKTLFVCTTMAKDFSVQLVDVLSGSAAAGEHTPNFEV